MTENVLPPGSEPDPARRGCSDCADMRGSVSWWCVNEDAIAARGTRIPGVQSCPFWSPARVQAPEPEPWWRRWLRRA